MNYNPDLATIRFGTGLGPHARPANSTAQMIARLTERDKQAQRFRIAGIKSQYSSFKKGQRLAKEQRQASPGAAQDRARDALRKHRQKLKEQQVEWFLAMLARSLSSEDGFRERLVRFWADHFTVVGKTGALRPMAATFSEDAIRPNIAGRFGDMLKDAVTHPLMLAYLDQFSSVGEDSPVARRQGKGLNENLAREVLELHTLGVGAGYSQTDVREFAKLLAGFTFSPTRGVVYQAKRATPGAETILGKSYGGDRPRIEDVYDALHDLALRPETARHIARKLAVHFVSDDPDPNLVGAITAAYQDSGGDLSACYSAMLEHPASWSPKLVKVKQPVDFIITSLRALGAEGKTIAKLPVRSALQGFARPMQMMGQTWERPAGPDGWPEEGGHWITPQGLAARIQWAMTAPQAFSSNLPDPRAFAQSALGTLLDDHTEFAAMAAETRWEGIGLVLSSPSFQRR